VVTIDDRLRRLDRDGTPEGEARLLLERVRAGQIPQARLELAAHLGHTVALGALGREDRPPRDLHALLESLVPFGGVSVIHGLLLAAETVGRCLDWGQVGPPGSLGPAQDWLASPCREHAERALLHAQESFPHPTPTPAHAACVRAEEYVLEAVYVAQAGGQLEPMVMLVSTQLEETGVDLSPVMESVRESLADAALE
jgi:hypothetical protein